MSSSMRNNKRWRNCKTKGRKCLTCPKTEIYGRESIAITCFSGKQGVKKDSHNPHNSPSQDKAKPSRNKSLRKKSNRKSGGQSGHKGHTLEMGASPDETKVLKSDYCQCCGADITALEHLLVSKRQEVVLPPIEAKFVEYRQYRCLSSCGHHQKSDYPSNVV